MTAQVDLRGDKAGFLELLSSTIGYFELLHQWQVSRARSRYFDPLSHPSRARPIDKMSTAKSLINREKVKISFPGDVTFALGTRILLRAEE